MSHDHYYFRFQSVVNKVHPVYSSPNGTDQWLSQNRVVARAQVGQHIWCCTMCGKLARSLIRVCRHAPPQGKIWNLGPPRSHLLGFQGSENNTHLQYSESAAL